jgi:hypothetical protein
MGPLDSNCACCHVESTMQLGIANLTLTNLYEVGNLSVVASPHSVVVETVVGCHGKRHKTAQSERQSAEIEAQPNCTVTGRVEDKFSVKDSDCS